MPITEQEKDIVRQQYGKVKIDYLQQLLPGRSFGAIHKMAQRLGVKSSRRVVCAKYSYDYDFFDIPNIANSYWAGFLAADGCINNKDDAISIGLARKDRCILEALQTQVSYTGRITDTYSTKQGQRWPSSRMQFFGAREWKQALETHWNITTRKSLTLEPPNITGDNIYSYIIGYFDGDGTAHWSAQWDNKGKTDRQIFNFGFVGTQTLLHWIKDRLHELCPPYASRDVNVRKNGDSCYQLKYRGRRAFILRDKLLEINLPFRLERKWSHKDG